MTDLRQTAQRAFEALEAGVSISPGSVLHDQFRTALEQQQAEPSMWGSGDGYWILAEDKPARPDKELFNIPFYTTPPQRKPLPKGEWPKHKSPYAKDEYIGYAQSDLDDYAMQVLAAHGIKEGT